MDRGSQWATVHGVTWSRTRLQPLSTAHSSTGTQEAAAQGTARHSQLKPCQYVDAEIAEEEEAVTLGAQNRPNFSSRYGWPDISPIQQDRNPQTICNYSTQKTK